MKLWLIRHAHASDGQPDPSRQLSPKGEKQVATLAAFLTRTKIPPPTRFRHSPYDRARQTAEQLCAGAGWPAALLEESRFLLPGDDPRLIADRVGDETEDLALVGHEPHLGRLASLLVGGDPDAELFAMEKGTILCLESCEPVGSDPGRFDHWLAAWMIGPGMLSETPAS